MTNPATTGPAPRLISCLGVASDLPLAPHFLRHYVGLGVAPERMHVILQSEDPDAPQLAEARALLERFGAAAPEIWIGPYTSDEMWERRRALQQACAAPDDWVLSADVDELQEYPEPLGRFLARLDRMGVTCAQGPFLDRLAEGGRLPAVTAEPDLWTQFPVAAEAMLTLAGRGEHHGHHGTVNLMAMKGDVLPRRGGHHPMAGQGEVRHLWGAPLADFPGVADPAWRFSLPLQVHHFAWTATRAPNLRRRLATPGVSPAGREYGSKVLARLEAGLDPDALPRRREGRAGPALPWMWPVRRLQAEAAARRLKKRLGARLRRMRA